MNSDSSHLQSTWDERILSLCRALEEGGIKVSDETIAFSKNGSGKH